MQFNISFKTIFEYILKKSVLCIQIRFVSTEKTTRIASHASCFNMYLNFTIRVLAHIFFSHIVLLTEKLNNFLSRVNDFMLCSNSQEKLISSHMVLFSRPTAIAYLQVSYYTTFYCQDYFPTQDTPRYTPLCMPVR